MLWHKVKNIQGKPQTHTAEHDPQMMMCPNLVTTWETCMQCPQGEVTIESAWHGLLRPSYCEHYKKHWW